ncbi:MutS family DNA mismatch repair protein [Staphylococcus pasteuri]|uniref:MutS family DNA mismatch repair protein n=1 Tax=Staphylococcus pasteuri TaxID=45972 RepID=UPI001AD88FF7|nr:MutS family DNA mismatch repair protein [Staphylococcus pasteuri]QQT11826.1 MutS family DNA mismatch repair protein [Staphylococcus pasteuri]
MDDVRLFLLFVLGVVLLTTIVSIISAIFNKKQLVTKINQLWPNRQKLENFIRPNARYDYQYQTYRSNYDENSLIDNKTWSDLNMDALFQSMNFNFTAIGEMRLYATLRGMFKANNKELKRYFKHNRSFRNQVAFHLAQIGKSVYPHFPDQLKPIKGNILFMFAPLLPIIALVYTFINTSNGIMVLVLACVFNIILSVSLKKTYEQDLKTIFYTANILSQSKKLTEIEGTPDLNVKFNHFKSARYLSGLLVKIEGGDFASAFILLIKTVFMLDYTIFHIIQNSYYKYLEEVLNCYDYIGQLDNHYAISLYQETLDEYCEPEIIQSQDTQHYLCDFEDLTHPLITDAVPNDLSINQNILLTGSNASGKSTFMKAVALNLILAQSIETATASQFKYVPGLVFTSMANADDVLSGDSYFMAELKSIRRLFNISTDKQIYCFIDEIFKGTNTTERIAASESVLTYLNNIPNYYVLAATHDIELSSLLSPSFINYHFNESIKNDSIDFDFKIKPGKANTRNAIELLRLTQFPNAIYKRAKQQVENQ